MSSVDTHTYPLDQLRSFCEAVFLHYGVPAAEARQAADVLQAADRRGIDSHGVARLKTYANLLEADRINPTPDVTIVRETPSAATVDGDNGLGLVVGPAANRIALDKAEAVGSGTVSVRHTNHFGIAGYYPLQPLDMRVHRDGDDELHRARGAALGRRADPGHQPHRHGLPGPRGAAHRD